VSDGRATPYRVRYSTIVADPPWQYQKAEANVPSMAESQYPTMTNAEIAALPIRDLADDNAHLYLWTTNPILTRQRWGSPDPIDICLAWGFQPKTIITWVKPGAGGMGWYFRGQTEHVIFAVRGQLPIPAELRVRNIIESARGRHSEKPDAFMDMVEQVSPEPRLELFSRRARFGWDTWGNEALGGTELAV
jgi:N6-adenosine-specific RNA methylase IME4